MAFEIPGFQFSTACAGIRWTDRPDMAMIVSDPPARWSGVFTTNRVKAAPVILGMERLTEGHPLSAVIINSGNANACTGKRGIEDVKELCNKTAHLLKVPDNQVLMASTGVIGQPLPMRKMEDTLQTLIVNLGESTIEDVAKAIMTTDRYPKWEISRTDIFPDIKIAGLVKGAGMIYPNMATMLGVFFMNAGLPVPILQKVTRRGVDESFNRILVDGDRSTNDTVLVLDNGSLMGEERTGLLKKAVTNVLNSMMRSLAERIVDNGEGVTKVVTLIVEGARKWEDARRVAESVGRSPLVKTAFYGEDPNWGRIMAAIGYSGADIKAEDVDIRFNDALLVSGGQFMGKVAESNAAEVMKNRAYTLCITIGRGEESYRLITSDLSIDYVKINADYRS